MVGQFAQKGPKGLAKGVGGVREQGELGQPAFYFTAKEAVEIAYIIARNQDNRQYLREVLAQALTLEKLLRVAAGLERTE